MFRLFQTAVLLLLLAGASAAQDVPADDTTEGPSKKQSKQPEDQTPQVRAGTDSTQKLHAPAASDEFSVAIFGDRTGGPREGLHVLAEAIRMANLLDVTFVMTVGDLIQGYNREATWRLQAAEFKGMMNELQMPWYPVAGNHDVYARPRKAGGHTELYKEQFGPLYYSFDYKWAHFIALFSDEQLAFHNPAKNQNMSPQQMQWLREDLAQTQAEQVFVFLHHPRWTYPGCNWPEVHDILAADGRVQAVVAGHIHSYRYDGIHDGVHYYALATTGGGRQQFRDTASIHHINHLRIRRKRWTMSVLPVGDLHAGDFVLGEELDAMRALAREAVHVTPSAVVSGTEERQSQIGVALQNSTDRRLPYKVELLLPDGWQLAAEITTDHGELAAGQRLDLPLLLRSPRFVGQEIKAPQVKLTLQYPLRSRLRQEISVTAQIPVRITGLAPHATPQAANKVLQLDGKSAVRIPLSASVQDAGQFTIECWVRGKAPKGRVGLLAKTESSAFGIFWSEPGDEPASPSGHVHLDGHGYLSARAERSWEWEQWHHLASCYDGEWLRLFVNGEQVAAKHKKGRMTTNQHAFYIGADPNSRGEAVSFFKGAIDDVRVSTTARYDANFTPRLVHSSDEHTVLLQHFDTTVGGLFLDASAHENHGWGVGSPKLVAESRRSQRPQD
ncbi:MAG: LamG-like jellyroll fold domain-containing protein [Planctomycetota bacterium]